MLWLSHIKTWQTSTSAKLWSNRYSIIWHYSILFRNWRKATKYGLMFPGLDWDQALWRSGEILHVCGSLRNVSKLLEQLHAGETPWRHPGGLSPNSLGHGKQGGLQVRFIHRLGKQRRTYDKVLTYLQFFIYLRIGHMWEFMLRPVKYPISC